MTPEISERFLLWPWGWQLTHKITGITTAALRSTLITTVLNEVHRRSSQNELVDLRGRESSATLLPAGTLLGTPLHDELFAVGGYVPKEERGDPFIFQIATPFLRFEGTHHIVHSVLPTGNIPARLTIAELARAFPLEITEMRCAFSFMRSSSISGLLGFAPITHSTLTFELTGGQVAFELVEQALAPRGTSKLLATPWIQKLWNELQSPDQNSGVLEAAETNSGQ